MMTTAFLIEFRLQGFARRYAKWVEFRIHQEAKRLGIKELKERRLVSHITLFVRERPNRVKRVASEIERTCRKYTLVPFKIGGFDSFRNPDANWLYLDVEPSSELEKLRYELAQNLIRSERIISSTCKPYDHTSKYKFHSAIGKFDPRDKDKFEKLLNYATTKCSLENFRQHKDSIFNRLFNAITRHFFSVKGDYPLINLHLLRVTVLGRRSLIQAEYDLVLKKLLSRRQALSRYWTRRTIDAFKALQESLKAELIPISPKSTFFIGDLHLDHNNIIKLVHRPFNTIYEMNKVIVSNWNNTIKKNDRVFFLGDYTGPLHERIYYDRLRCWTSQLNGVKTSILGNHDQKSGCIIFENSKVIHVDRRYFLLIHNPEDRSVEWHEWIIHGHKHNNDMDRYPFINGEKKTINVSVELIDYKPVSLEYLLSLNLDSIKRMQTITSQPERW